MRKPLLDIPVERDALLSGLARVEADLDVADAQLRAAKGRYDDLATAKRGMVMYLEQYAEDEA